MIFKRLAPDPGLEHLIECYWIVESQDPTPQQQKIIPDGFPEIIFHYGDPYRINLGTAWELQSASLLGGQLRNYFYLENTGVSGIVGIKLKPTAVTHLFNISMDELTDKVVDLPLVTGHSFQPIAAAIRPGIDHDTIIRFINDHVKQLAEKASYHANHADRAVTQIIEKKGMITVAELIGTLGTSERNLERIFKKYIGLSPKFYTRIIRFNTIFQLIQEGDPRWTSIAFDSGFYDQSHFIRNFKAFTGEDPTRYFFDEQNMANFFLKKKGSGEG